VLTHTWFSGGKIQYMKRAGRKEYKEKDREDVGRMVKR
jgi:hypothetical protein